MLTRKQVVAIYDRSCGGVPVELLDTDAALRAEVKALEGGMLHDVLVSQEQTIATLRTEIDRLRSERTDDQLHTDNIELRIEIKRLGKQALGPFLKQVGDNDLLPLHIRREARRLLARLEGTVCAA